jgi:hypothetical protein
MILKVLLATKDRPREREFMPSKLRNEIVFKEPEDIGEGEPFLDDYDNLSPNGTRFAGDIKGLLDPQSSEGQ